MITPNILILWREGQKLAHRLKWAAVAASGVVRSFESVVTEEWVSAVQRTEEGVQEESRIIYESSL